MKFPSIIAAGLAALTLTTAPAANATTLVSPAGQPTGGQWQQWADDALAPTSPTTTQFSADPAVIAKQCMGAEWVVYLACTAAWTQQSGDAAPTLNSLFVGVLPASAAQRYDPTGAQLRQNLYKELGQVFDATVLTDQDRLTFERIFSHARHDCASCASVQDLWYYSPSGGESSYAEWFGEGWELCATFGTLTAQDTRSSEFEVAGGYPIQWAAASSYRYSARKGRFLVDRKRQQFALDQQQRVCQLIQKAAAHGPTILPGSSSLTPARGG